MTATARVALAAALLAPGPGARGASDLPPPPEEVFTGAIEVRIIDLEVVVRDRDGLHVPDLRVEDFVVRVNGEPVPIAHFEEIREEGGPAGAAPGAASPPPTNVLVFIDDWMTLARNRNFVLERLRRELGELGREDRMALVAYAGDKLEVLSDWTADRDALDRSLAAAIERRGYGIKYIALRRMTGFVANWEGNDTRRSILAAAASLRALPAPPGRRALLLVAGSWDPVEARRADAFSPWCVSGWCQGSGVYDILTDTANLLDYSIYAVDVEGRDPDQNWSRETRIHHVLREMARVTGGRYLLDTDRRRMLSLTAGDKSSYYSLGFSPSGDGDDGRRGVSVEVLRPGVRVRSQETFVQVTRERNRQLELFNALLGPGGDGGSLAIAAGSGAPSGYRTMEVPLNVQVPTGALTWTIEKTGHRARFSVETAYVDRKNRSSEVETREFDLVRKSLPQRGAVEEYSLRLVMPRRSHTVGVFVRDLLGREVFSGVVEVQPAGRRD